MKILFAGGGTGGHLYSGIAVAREIQRLAPNAEIVFVGTQAGIESKVLPRENFRLITLKMSGIKGRGLIGAATGALRVPGALLASLSLLRRENPDAVVGIGGYASGPTVFAAAIAGLPTSIIEQNVIPGFTNRTLARFVRRIYAPMEEAVARFPNAKKVSVTGNPIRRNVVDEAIAGRRPVDERTRLLVFGGSLGASHINAAMVAALPALKALPGLSIVHQTGTRDLASTKAAYEKELAGSGVTFEVLEFLHDMGARYAAADLLVCRAGASTLSEILAIGKPAILVPFPHAIYNHQELNARALEARGAARWILDSELTGETIFREVAALAADPLARAKMSEAARSLGRPEAAATIAREVLAAAGAPVTTEALAATPPASSGTPTSLRRAILSRRQGVRCTAG